MIRFLTGMALLSFLLFTRPALADGDRGQSAYEASVRPLLEKFCGDCHQRETSEQRWAFDNYAGYAELVADQKLWHKARQLLANHLMPPQGQASPSAGQRRVVLDWIDNVVFYADPDRPDPGRIVPRRLNRAEYNNSIRDVFGIESRPADRFPADDAGYGFDNIADVLTVSPLHVEKFLAAARQVADDVTRLDPPPRAGKERTGDMLEIFGGNPRHGEKLVVLGAAKDEVGTSIEIPTTSVYRIVVRAATVRFDDDENVPLEVLCDGKPIAELKPTAQWKGKPGPSSTVFALVELESGEHRISLRVKAETSVAAASETLAGIGFLGISGPFTPMPPTRSTYLQAAWPQRSLAPPILRLSGEDLDSGSGRSSLDTGRAWFSSKGYRRAPLLIRSPGEYRLRFKVGAQQAGDQPVRFEARLGDQTLAGFTVTVGSQVEQWVEATCNLPAGEHDWQVWFVNEYKDPATGAERWFWLHEFSIEGPLGGAYDPTPDEAIELLEHTARQLFRRSPTDNDRQKLASLYHSTLRAGHVPLAALRLCLEALLVSPRFLYHPLPEPAGDAGNGNDWIDELTLAARLASFLWSSAPDEELLTLAERRELRKGLVAQVRRMIHAPRSAALTENFAGQWLQLRDLENVTPDATLFPPFNAELAADMRRETEMLFAYILQENRPAIDFLNADYTFANARLARHYDLPQPEGEGFQKISLAGSPRRGVLTHGSVLSLTSHPTRTSPVKRGKWVLEQMLGIEPPPAPRDVPPLPEAHENESLPLRVRLEQHNSNQGCASCHALLDPIGFALENYDAIGRWRERDGHHPIDASGQLVTGEKFANWSQARELLANHYQDDFVRCLAEHLLTYALGRGTTYHDKTAIDALVTQARSSGGSFADLILGVCQSVPFQQMRRPSP